MNSIKITLIFTILATAIIGCLWAMDILPLEQAQDIFGKAIAVVLIVGFSLSLIFYLARTSKSKEENAPKGPGPKF